MGLLRGVSSTSDLMENILAKLKIFLLTLRSIQMILLSEQNILTMPAEMDWIVRNEYRNRYISKLANSLNGNTLILFSTLKTRTSSGTTIKRNMS